MVLNYIWVAFFLIAFIIAAAKLVFMGDYDVFPDDGLYVLFIKDRI